MLDQPGFGPEARPVANQEALQAQKVFLIYGGS